MIKNNQEGTTAGTEGIGGELTLMNDKKTNTSTGDLGEEIEITPSQIPCRCGKKGAITSMEKAYDFWFNTIKENNPKFFRAGCEWMIQYWTKRMLDGE